MASFATAEDREALAGTPDVPPVQRPAHTFFGSAVFLVVAVIAFVALVVSIVALTRTDRDGTSSTSEAVGVKCGCCSRCNDPKAHKCGCCAACPVFQTCTARTLPAVINITGQRVARLSAASPFANVSTVVRRARFASGRTCIVFSIQSGQIWRVCDDNAPTMELWLDFSSQLNAVCRSFASQAGVVGFDLNANGTRFYLDIHANCSAHGQQPSTFCDMNSFYSTEAQWLALPVANIATVYEYVVSGAQDAVSAPFALLSYESWGLAQQGYDTLRLDEAGGKQTLFIAVGDNNEDVAPGRYYHPDQIPTHIWAMDLAVRRLTPAMTTPVRRYSALPAGVRASMTDVMSGMRNVNAPVVDRAIRSDGPVLAFTNLGKDNGDSMFGVVGFNGVNDTVAGRTRDAGWPEFSGLTQSAIDHNTLCGSKKRGADDALQTHQRTERADSTPFPPLDHLQIFRMLTNRQREGRYYPFGWIPGWSGLNGGTSTSLDGNCDALIGSAFVRSFAGDARCPLVVSACFQTLWNNASGIITRADPVATAKYGKLLNIPHFQAWLPNYMNLERQSATIDISLVDVLAPSYDGGASFLTTTMAPSRDQTEIYAVFSVLGSGPAEARGQLRTEVWRFQLHL